MLIAESHISIHTFPEKNFVSFDIFSCKPFDSEFAAANLKRLFGMEKVECTVLDRGTELPKDLNGATRLVRAARRRMTRPVARAAARQECAPRPGPARPGRRPRPPEQSRDSVDTFARLAAGPA
mgnify:CR=1 FL=1